MMLDPDRRFLSRPIASPLNMPCNDVFRSLKPFKANHRHRCAFRLGTFYAALCESVDLFSRRGRLDQLYPGFHRDTQPGIRNSPVKLLGIKSMHDAPCLPAEQYDLFSCPEPLAFLSCC